LFISAYRKRKLEIDLATVYRLFTYPSKASSYHRLDRPPLVVYTGGETAEAGLEELA
jgi:hypothetical protein